MSVEITIETLVEASRQAQLSIEDYTQEEIDLVVKTLGKAIYDHAEILSQEAVEETDFGNVESKIGKHVNVTMLGWHFMKDKKSVGVIEEDIEKQLITIAKPMGVVASVTPSTNPTSTATHNAMSALKSKNSVIIAPHPKAKNCTLHAVKIMQDAIESVGAPRELVQAIEAPSIEMTNELMKQADIVVATGGFSMVKSAYSSGKPSYGVGQGNVQSFIDNTANIKEATQVIVGNRAADFGIPCTGDQTVYIPKSMKKEVLDAFENQGAFILEDEEKIQQLKEKVFVNGHQNLALTGKLPYDAVQLMGLDIELPKETRVLMVEVNQEGPQEVLSKEILWPILRFRTYDDIYDAFEWGRTNLLMEGAGHTATLFSENEETIIRAGERLPVGRMMINQGGGAGSGSRYNNGLDPTISLGCGSWGNNSISENLTYRHLMNVTKVSRIITNAYTPTPEEVWGE